MILERCRVNTKNEYLFLSKALHSYVGISWPSNTMQGITETLEKNRALVNYPQLTPRPFFSVEPIMGYITRDIAKEVELVIVGAETGNRKGKVIPQKEWIQSIKDHVLEEKIYWKKNIQAYL